MSARAGLHVVPVPLGERAYDVVVGDGALDELASLVPSGTRRAAVVTQAGIGVEVDPGVPTEVFEIGVGEATKSLATVEDLCRGFTRFGLTRGDVVVGVGGGMVTDVAGFAASIHHRGTPVLHVATTLLGQIDAAIGGKTGVNLAEGKNLVGTFWQPSGVICDTATLATLPPDELRSGQGEMAKYRFLGVEHLLDLAVADQVAACVRVKAEVVAADEREGASGVRAALNYGHTLAHALETLTDYQLRHGEAVAIGLVFAAELAQRLGRIDAGRVAEHRQTVAAYGLPSTIPAGLDPEAVIAQMARDKKALAGITFVLDGPDGVRPVHDVARDIVLEALEATR